MSGAPEANGELSARVAAELARWTSEPLTPGLYVVATPIGNLGDISIRALATLARADLICCEDTRHSRALLGHFAISRPTRALHEHNEDAEAGRIVAMIGEGRAIALVSDAGTPLVSDPGFRLVRAVIEAGHQVTALPGPSAVLAALAIAGLPTDQVLFAGFLPAKETARRQRLAELLPLPSTVVLYEAPGRVADLLADIARTEPERRVVVARELTKRFEEVRRGTASELATQLADEALRGEFVVLLGPATPRQISEADIERALRQALETMSLRDAARTVSEALAVPRSRVYELGLAMKGPRA